MHEGVEDLTVAGEGAMTWMTFYGISKKFLSRLTDMQLKVGSAFAFHRFSIRLPGISSISPPSLHDLSTCHAAYSLIRDS